jgi:hypothetical protein
LLPVLGALHTPRDFPEYAQPTGFIFDLCLKVEGLLIVAKTLDDLVGMEIDNFVAHDWFLMWLLLPVRLQLFIVSSDLVW